MRVVQYLLDSGQCPEHNVFPVNLKPVNEFSSCHFEGLWFSHHLQCLFYVISWFCHNYHVGKIPTTKLLWKICNWGSLPHVNMLKISIKTLKVFVYEFPESNPWVFPSFYTYLRGKHFSLNYPFTLCFSSETVFLRGGTISFISVHWAECLVHQEAQHTCLSCHTERLHLVTTIIRTSPAAATTS